MLLTLICEDDEKIRRCSYVADFEVLVRLNNGETIFDRIVGRTWVGDLGFESDDRFHDPLESGIYLGADGFGEDQLCYYDNGDYYGKPLRLQWRVGNGALYIDYGNVAAPREFKCIC